MLSMLGKISLDDILKCFFFLFFFPHKIGIDISYNLHIISKTIFCEKQKKYFSIFLC